MLKLHLADFEHLSSAFRTLTGDAISAIFHFTSFGAIHLSLILTFHAISLYHFYLHNCKYVSINKVFQRLFTKTIYLRIYKTSKIVKIMG